jgi:hypothetical protein
MATGYRVEYSDDDNEVCIIPMTGIPTEDYFLLIEMFGANGYKWMVPADERRGYRFVKKRAGIDG